jgi:hypothetical protein
MANQEIQINFIFSDQLRTLLGGNLNEMLKNNDLVQLFQRRKRINELQFFLQNANPIAAGGMGAVYPYGTHHIIKQTKICPGDNPISNEMCNLLARKDDPQYETIDTTLNKDKYIIPNYILELFNGIYLSNKLEPYTDGFSRCYGGLYDKTNRVTYAIQELLIQPNNPLTGLANGFSSMSDSDYLYFLLELFLTLGIAQDKYKFVHYDLHLGNIMFRSYSQPKQRIYNAVFTDLRTGTTAQVSAKFESPFQPVIIDYGFSRFETDDTIVSPTYNFRNQAGSTYLDNHLYNPYYDMITILRSFMIDFDPTVAANPHANQTLYQITISLLQFIFNNMPYNQIDSRLFNGRVRVKMDELNTIPLKSLQEICNLIMTIINYQQTPLIRGDTLRVPDIQSFHINMATTLNRTVNTISNVPAQDIRRLVSVLNPNDTFRYYDARNLNLFTNFKFIQAPLNDVIGGIQAGFAWQFQNYQLSRTNDFGLTNAKKWYNFTYNNPMYDDAVQVSCAVMWQPNVVGTPFRFSSECCRIDTKRFLQEPSIKEGITINGSFFNWKSDFKPIGYFKKNQIVLDNTEVSYNYLNDFYYIRIDENGALSISNHNVKVSDQTNDPFFDETKNTSVFLSGPKLVANGVTTFTRDKIGHYYYDSATRKRYYKYLSTHGNTRLDGIAAVNIQAYYQAQELVPYNAVLGLPMNQDPQILQQGVLPPNFNVITALGETIVPDINSLRPGDLIHALNPNPRAVLATTNNGLVLFFTFAGRGDAPINANPATGLDFIDLSSILANPALIAPLGLPLGTFIQDAINLDGGGSASVNIKDSSRPYILTSGMHKISSYPVGNILAYTYK